MGIIEKLLSLDNVIFEYNDSFRGRRFSPNCIVCSENELFKLLTNKENVFPYIINKDKEAYLRYSVKSEYSMVESLFVIKSIKPLLIDSENIEYMIEFEIMYNDGIKHFHPKDFITITEDKVEISKDILKNGCYNKFYLNQIFDYILSRTTEISDSRYLDWSI